ncbi:hypothetical protein AVEN_135191-1 [Araneus ventricosus]|uniref:Uncharacterized protein n=1 Tax=Araneus ventricosus TaxID=182803 RepID=A0A4Y2JXW1_ARAVE|nr:hypothetical protein AVEN_135191-1 [Araneus ventricosus]
MNLQKKDQFWCDNGICGQKTRYKENQKLGIYKRKYHKGRKQMKVTGVPDKLDPVKQKEAAEESEEKRLKVMAMLENDQYLYDNVVYCYLMKKEFCQTQRKQILIPSKSIKDGG